MVSSSKISSYAAACLCGAFNDDFRIAVPNFTAAINAIEALSEEARALGLVINEQKTTTPGLISYAFRVFGLNAATDLLPVEAVEEPEVLVSDYADLPADTEEAAGVLNAAVSADASPSLAELSVDDIRNLRRALWTLVRSKDPAALELIRPFSIYVPSLTPLLCRYFWVLSEDYSADVAAQIDSVIQNVSLGGWQRLWFNYLLYKTGFLGDGTPGDLPGRVSFAKACSSDASHPATRAEAMLALASGHRVGIGAVADSLIAEPRALSSWYVTAAALAAATDQDEKVLGGISGSDPFSGSCSRQFGDINSQGIKPNRRGGDSVDSDLTGGVRSEPSSRCDRSGSEVANGAWYI